MKTVSQQAGSSISPGISPGAVAPLDHRLYLFLLTGRFWSLSRRISRTV